MGTGDPHRDVLHQASVRQAPRQTRIRGTTGKRLLTEVGGVELDVPRDRNGTFAPQIVRKGQTRLNGFNDRIIALYGRGLSTRDIRSADPVARSAA
jgi:transposase-like protein